MYHNYYIMIMYQNYYRMGDDDMATPQYVKDANNRYNSKFDLIQIKLPKGTKERIKKQTKESYNIFINNIVLAELERLEKQGGQELPDFMKD